MNEQRRTDLALEAKDLYEERSGGSAPGVSSRQRLRAGFPVTDVRVESEQGAAAVGKAIGRYLTVDLSGLHRREENAFSRAVEALAEELKSLLPPLSPGDGVLVAGLGNRAMTPDAIGPKVTDHTLVTRHLVEQVPEHFGSLRPVAALAPGVLGTTGMESGEVVKAAAEQIHPKCVVAVDALCARAVERLCVTVQMSDTGISPGSGVGNRRAALDRHSLGVPVIVVGVPTVVDAATVAADILAENGLGEVEPETLRGNGASLMVTPKDIDARVDDMAKAVGYGITLALQDTLSLEDVELFLS